VEVWVELTGGGTGGQYGSIVTERENGGINYVLGVSTMYFPTTPPPGSANIWLGHFNGNWYNLNGGNSNGNTFNIAFSSTTWLHIVGTYDGLNFRTYLNGFLQNSVASTGTPKVEVGVSIS
jgi:hypothetical protein